jgi:glycosyltransferase 2 family protein
MLTKLYKSQGMRLGIGLMVSAVLLYLAFRGASLTAVWAVLSHARLGYVAAALACVGLTILFKVLRWQVMLGPPGAGVPFADLLMSNLSGQMLNTLFPLRVGDLSRAVVIGREGPGWAFVLGTVVLEKIVDFVWLALTFVLLLALIPLPDWVGDSGWILVGAAALMCGVTFGMAASRQRLMQLVEAGAARIPLRWTRVRNFSAALVVQLHKGLASLDIVQQRHKLLLIALWSTLIWSAGVLTNYLVLLALGLDVGLSASVLILVSLMVGISVAAVPGRIGVFEWICVLALAVYGVDQAPALSYGLLLHVIVYAPVMLFGVLSFFILVRKNASSRMEKPVSDGE